MIESIISWFIENVIPFIALCVAFIGLGVSIRRYELAKMDKNDRDEKDREKKNSEFKSSVYQRFHNIETTLSSLRSDIENNEHEIDLVDDYSKKVRQRVIKLDELVTDSIKASNEALGYSRAKSDKA